MVLNSITNAFSNQGVLTAYVMVMMALLEWRLWWRVNGVAVMGGGDIEVYV